MKKLFMFLAVAGLATFGTACSSDDSTPEPGPGPGPGPVAGQLVLTASPTTAIEVGGTFTFTVMLEKANVTTSSDIYVNGAKITGNTYSSATAGKFTVLAKGKDVKDSKEITVEFKEKAAAIKSITLTSDAGATPAYGQLVTFTVKGDTGADVTATSVLKVNGVAVTGNTYTLKAGNNSVVATYVVEGTTLTSNTLAFNGIVEPTFTSFFSYDGAKFETTNSQYAYDGIFEQGADVYDVWILMTFSLDEAGEDIKDAFAFTAALKRTNPTVKVFPPANGNITTGFPGSTAVVINGENVAENNRVKDFGGMTLANFNPQVSGNNLISGPTTNFVFGVTMTDNKIVAGTHTGEVYVFAEADAARRSASVQKVLKKVNTFSAKKSLKSSK